MRILFIILAILGILLLLIVLFMALCALHPVFYRIEGELEEKAVWRVSFSWLFHLLRLDFSWDGGQMQARVRLLWLDRTFDSADDGGEPSESETGTIESSELTIDSKGPPESACNNTPDWEKESAGNQSPPDQTTGSVRKKARRQKDGDKQPGQKKRPQHSSGSFARFKQELVDEGNRLAISHLWREIRYLLSHFKPKYITARISFSLGDPAWTGQATGALSLFPFLYRSDVHIHPDFLAEECYVRGSFMARGHMTPGHLAISLIRMIRDKNIRKCMRKFRK